MRAWEEGFGLAWYGLEFQGVPQKETPLGQKVEITGCTQTSRHEMGGGEGGGQRGGGGVG